MRFAIASSSRVWFCFLPLLWCFLFFETSSTFKPIQLTQPGPFFNPEASCPVWQRRSTVHRVERSCVLSKDRKHKVGKRHWKEHQYPCAKAHSNAEVSNYLITRQRSA